MAGTLTKFAVACKESQRDLNHSAQGCEARATLGESAKMRSTLKGLNQMARADSTPLGLMIIYGCFPSVAAARQRWAD
jgi:hypothetical protein